MGSLESKGFGEGDVEAKRIAGEWRGGDLRSRGIRRTEVKGWEMGSCKDGECYSSRAGELKDDGSRALGVGHGSLVGS